MLQWLVLLQTVTGTADPASPAGEMPVPVRCQVVDARSAEAKQSSPDAPADLLAVCGTRGVRLGTAVRQSSSFNASTNSMVVQLLRASQQGEPTYSVLLVAARDNGTLQVDDLTRELTLLSGRYAEAGLASGADLSAFASDGVVSVTRVTTPRPPEGRGMVAAARSTSGQAPVVSTAVLDLKPYAVAAHTGTNESGLPASTQAGE